MLQFMLIKLTVLYKRKMEVQHLYKVAKFESLVTDLRDDGYTVRFCAIKVAQEVSSLSLCMMH